MIRIDAVTTKELRGIRDLPLNLGGKNFAICGPNGTGKSGVVDALEFALTGNVSRLSGEGRGDISLKDHGPHVDIRSAPEKSKVVVKVTTVVTDHVTGNVLEVGQDRKQETFEAYLKTMTPAERGGITHVSMDMWQLFINAVLALVPGAEHKINFDKYHVASHLGKGVDRVRRGEHVALMEAGDETLKKTKYLWLTNPANMKRARWREFEALRTSSLKTARAWALKEVAMSLWNYRSPTWATKAWKAWLSWALRSRLEPMRKVARMVREHLWGILNAVTSGVTNALGESINAKIERIKHRACGFRNRVRFRDAIFFHLGGLDLYPETLRATHTNP